MRIEAARAEDLEEIYGLTNELEATVLPWDSFKEIYGRVLESGDDYILVARENGILGYVHGRLTEELHHGCKISTVQEMIVKKEDRRKHIGSGLLKAAIGLSGARGAAEIELTSHFSRTGAHQFYESLGFEKTSYKLVLELPAKEASGGKPEDSI